MRKVIIDTSVWAEYFRGKNEDIVKKVRELIENDGAVLCGIVLSELIAGVRKQKDEEIMRDALMSLPYLETTMEIWILTGRIARELMSKGKKIPLTDVILAASALKKDFAVFTLDAHFESIPDIKIF